ncbi:MAG: DUF211 domain-containing protein [Candidatus Nanohalobium sp.]
MSGCISHLKEGDLALSKLFKLTVEGEDISEEKVKDSVEGLGGSIHSIDEIVCGNKMVEQVETPQDG